MNLTVQFFAVYLLLFVVQRAKMFAPEKFTPMLTSVEDLLQSMAITCEFCPMLAILFVGVRMRALELTDQKGAPPGWVQDAMFGATFAVLAQLLLCLLQKVPVKAISGLSGILGTAALLSLHTCIIAVVT